MLRPKGFGQSKIAPKSYFCINQIEGLDLRMVFSNQNAKLYKGSPTSYAAYCEKHGIRYANKWIPEDWLEEARQGEQGAA